MPDNKYREELKGYVSLGKRYIRKSSILAVVFGALALAAAFAAVGLPLYRKYFGVMTVYSPWLQEFSGWGQVYDLDKELLYEGDISGGAFTGFGRLYRRGKELLYEGGFQNGDFSGEGTLYNPEGYPVYRGGFINGRYNGFGRLYHQDALVYEGGFLEGVYSGLGELYEDEVLLYEGNFLNGLYNGLGKLYEEERLLYDGEFLAGAYSGQGKLYDKTGLVYEGNFLSGEYGGLGSLYNNAKLLYEGEFANGLYNGQGKLFDSSYQHMIYEGEFVNGKYSGQGKEYNQLGRLVYDGAYSDGKRNGFGELYSDRGNLLYSGLFLQGEIDYVSLLGKHHSDIPSIFPGRSHLSYGSRTVPVAVNGQDELISDEIDLVEEYFCEGYEEIKAAIIFSVNADKPDWAEAIIVWDLKGDYDLASFIGNKIPFWIDVFYDNPMSPLRLKSPVRRVTQRYEDEYQIYFWTEDGQMDAEFYTVEYPSEFIEVK